MKRKATFFPKPPKKNSSDHNSRKEIPKYLIETDPNFSGNYYERIAPYLNDEQFKELAKKVYNEKFIERTGQNQKMQKKQVEALLKEVVISTEEHHGKEDILELFDMLKKEKAEENHHQKSMSENLLKPYVSPAEYKLPKKLKIKRKPKKENLDETGYHILELAGHYDEGHFVRTGKWEGLSYYPSRDIMLKDDGKWYIKSNELSERTDEDVFDVLADMSEFEKVFNYHWHVKYTDFNIETGLTARFSKREISGEGRLKKVAKYLGLRYVPEEKIPLAQGVKSIKEQHHIDRQNKYRQLMMKFKHIEQQQQKDAKIESVEQHLAKQVTRKHEEQRNSFYLQGNLTALYQEILELKMTLQDTEGKLNSRENRVKELEDQVVKKEAKVTELASKVNELEKKYNQEVQLRKTKENGLAREKDAVKVLTSELASKTEQLNKVNSKKINVEKELSTTKKTLKEKEKKNKELKERVEQLKELAYSDRDGYRNGEKTGRKLTYKHLYEFREQNIKTLKDQIKEKEDEIAGFGAKVKELETKKNQEVQNSTEKEKELAKEKDAFSEIKSKFDSLTEQFNELTSEKLNLEEGLISANRSLKSEEKENENLKKEIDKLSGLVYSDRDIYRNGEKTDKKFTYKRLFELRDEKLRLSQSTVETYDNENKKLQEDITQRDLEIEWLSEQLLLLKESIPELDEPELFIDGEESYANIELEAKKKENENLTEVIYKMRDYDIPKSALEGDIENIVKTVKEGIWRKRIQPQKNTASYKSSGGFKPGR